MSLFSRRRAPEEVFTPRVPQINKEMYVDRSDLEKRLVDLVQGGKHIIIHGDSGNGKTWLYKKVFETQKVSFEVINLANVGRFGGVLGCIRQKVYEIRGEKTETTQTTVNHEGGLNAAVVGFKGGQQQQFKHLDRDFFSEIMDILHSKSKGKKSLLVFDNFEAISGNDHYVQELAQLLILLDDESVAKFNCRIAVVGVPSGIRDYLQRVSNLHTISNRMSELPEVARLSPSEAKALLFNGFEELYRT